DQQFRQVAHILDVVVEHGQLVVRYGNQLGVLAGFVAHVEDAYRAGADHGARYYRVRGDHQHVQRVAIFGQGVRDVAVVGRVEHRRGHEAVHEHGVAVLVDLVLDRVAVGRNLDDDRSEERRVGQGCVCR